MTRSRFDADLERLTTQLANASPVKRIGRVVEVSGLTVWVSGLKCRVGDRCEIADETGRATHDAEVTGHAGSLARLSLLAAAHGLSTGLRVSLLPSSGRIPLGAALLGRVIDGRGQPMDGLGPIVPSGSRSIHADPPDPMTRRMMSDALFTGVRAIDACITLAEGQRVGVMAPAGVGKSTLMGMLARSQAFDVTVVGLIGERGREVREFIEYSLGPEGRARSVVVCATSDRASMERANAALVATTIAEYFRDQGLRVLLMMDSFTRYARALREVGLANGEAPARRGYPASVFAELPRILERSGMGEKGSITAIYTLLAEDDTASDPITEEVRGILDGHIVLSRRIAARGQYPAIDVTGSLSRVMSQVVSPAHEQANRQVRRWMSKYDELELLVQMGEYTAGRDPVGDTALSKIDAIRAFLSQETSRLYSPIETMRSLVELTST